MPEKITEITPEQTARFDEWAKKWIAIGLSTEPAEFERAGKAALKCYEYAKLTAPEHVLHFGSPFGASIGGALAVSLIAGEIDQNEMKNTVQNLYHGCLWASWGAYVSFFRDVMHWENPVLERFAVEEELILTCGWVWWHEKVCIIVDRPKEINLDENGRLHSVTGPAIAYRDGWSLWYVHGVGVPQYVVEKPQEITVSIIDHEQNAEVRRVMIERYKFGEETTGNAAFVRDAGGERLDHDERYGTLWRRAIPNDEPIVMIELINSSREPDGSFKHYWQRCHPELRPLPPGEWSDADKRAFVEKQTPQEMTAHAAVASLHGMRAEEYNPQIET